MIKALALSLVRYLGPALLLSQYFGDHLVERINNYTFFLLESQFVEERKNGTFSFSCGVDVFCIVTMSLQFLEHPWVIRVLILVRVNVVV